MGGDQRGGAQLQQGDDDVKPSVSGDFTNDPKNHVVKLHHLNYWYCRNDMTQLPYFWGYLSANEAFEVLNESGSGPGSYLLRKAGCDLILSVLTDNEEVHHYIVSDKRSQVIVKHFNLQSIQEIVQKMTKIGLKFLHQVQRPQETPAKSHSQDALGGQTCHICERDVLQKMESHLRCHRLFYCPRFLLKPKLSLLNKKD